MPEDFNAIERQRWGGPSPWAGRDSRTDAQKRDDEHPRREGEHWNARQLSEWLRAWGLA